MIIYLHVLKKEKEYFNKDNIYYNPPGFDKKYFKIYL